MSWSEVEIPIEDSRYFKTLNGLWTGKKPPFKQAGVIRNTNFTSAGKIDYSKIAYLEVEEKQLSSRKLEPGDIIIERSGGGPKQPVGRVVFFDEIEGEFSFSNFTSAIRVSDKRSFEPKFVFYRLLELYQSGRTEDIQRRTTGIRNLDFTAYKQRARIPRIPLKEQREIVDILSTVQRAIEAQQSIIQTTTELKQALMQKLFSEGLRGEPQKETEIGLVPESWEVCTVGDVAMIQSGGTPSRENPDNWLGGTIPWVKTGEINYRTIVDTEEKITQCGLSNSSARIFSEGTLLMAMYGQGITRGRVGILGIEAATNQACAAIIPLDESRTHTGFLYYFFEYNYESLRLMGHGANQKNLSATLIKSLSLPLPPAGDQRLICQTFSSFDERIRIARNKMSELLSLSQSLLNDLMNGTITTKQIHPNTELS